jgi:predicted RNase H-like nuclease
VPGTRVLGVDGFKDAWVAVALDAGGFAGAYLAPRLPDLVAAAGVVAVVGVDIPIGLLDTRVRDADREAQRFVGPRRSSVFLTPVRAAVLAPDYPSAVQINQKAAGTGISRQAYALRHKIREVDEWADRSAHCVVEVHPEVSFAAMRGTPLTAPKKSWAGMIERRRLLREHGIVVPDELGTAGRAAVDDVLDAAAVAWTARRIAAGEHRWLPPIEAAVPGRTDAVIWY